MGWGGSWVWAVLGSYRLDCFSRVRESQISTEVEVCAERNWPQGDQAYDSYIPLMLESVHTVLTQPGTPVSFRGMFIHSLFDFRKLRNFRCFPFPENSGTPTFPISGNSGLRHFLLLVIPSCILPFTCDSVVPPCFMYYSRLCTQVFSLYPVHTCPIP